MSLERLVLQSLDSESLQCKILVSLSARPKPPGHISSTVVRTDARALYEELTETLKKNGKRKKKVKAANHFLMSLFKVRENGHLKQVFETLKRESGIDIRILIESYFEEELGASQVFISFSKTFPKVHKYQD